MNNQRQFLQQSLSLKNLSSIFALYFLTSRFILFGKVEPQLSLILSPLGDVPNSKTFAPKLLKSFGPDL